MEKEILLQIPLCSNNLLCARLTTSAVCSLLKLNIDESEDIKVCVNEACLIIMGNNFSRVRLKYDMQENLRISVQGDGNCGSNSINLDKNAKEISLMLLNSLIDKVEYQKEDGIISSITLIKRMKVI